MDDPADMLKLQDDGVRVTWANGLSDTKAQLLIDDWRRRRAADDCRHSSGHDIDDFNSLDPPVGVAAATSRTLRDPAVEDFAVAAWW